MPSFKPVIPRGTRSYAVPSFSPGASAASPNSPFIVFDRQAKLAQRERAAQDKHRSRLTDYVKDDVAGNMVDRLLVSRANDVGPVCFSDEPLRLFSIIDRLHRSGESSGAQIYNIWMKSR